MATKAKEEKNEIGLHFIEDIKTLSVQFKKQSCTDIKTFRYFENVDKLNKKQTAAIYGNFGGSFCVRKEITVDDSDEKKNEEDDVRVSESNKDD